MAAFDFLASHPRYAEDANTIARLNTRHRFLIDPFRDDINEARVLDLAAHDGRWSMALAEAGAAMVVGIEARADLIAQHAELDGPPSKDRVMMEQGDIFDRLDELTSENIRFEVVTLFGIFYHVMDHFRLLRKCVDLRPKLILIDSEFMKGNWPFIKMLRETTDNPLNAAPQIAGQPVAIKGVPSSIALERMAQALNCRVDWSDWNTLPEDQRDHVTDYFRGDDHKMIRRTCALRPFENI